MSGVIVSVPRAGVVLWELHDADTRNALTPEVVADLRAAVETFEREPLQRVAVLTGRGTVFCSGGNTKAMGAARPRPLERKQAMWSNIQRLIRDMAALDKPVIAAVNGPAVGAGADLALHADIRLMADDAWLRLSYVDLGVVPGGGAAWTLPRLLGTSRALELLWTGRKIDAGEAAESGLVSRVTASADLLPTTFNLAEEIASKPMASIQLIKRMVRQAADSSLPAALDLASSHFAVLQETDDHAEAIEAIRERRPPRFRDR